MAAPDQRWWDHGTGAAPEPLGAAARAVGRIGTAVSMVGRARGKFQFPLRAPTVPLSVEPPARRARTGVDYDTEWARTPAARWIRSAIVEGPMRLMVAAVADPQRNGLDRLCDLRDRTPVPPVIFAANHHSHLDTALLITSIPEPWRHRLVVGAAADYFFATTVTGALSALTLNAFPVERSTVGRRSTDLAASLITDGWSLLIYPEGGRSPDGWAQEFHRGAAFLADKCEVPVVPVHIAGTGTIFGKGMSRPRPGTTIVTFGAPMEMSEGESTRRFNDRIERRVWELADESDTDWWSARRRAANEMTPSLSGPESRSWRRAWQLADHHAAGRAGRRRRRQPAWPNLDS